MASLGIGQKRKARQREADFPRIAELYCAGKSQPQIAEIIGISQSQVCRELAVVREQWKVRSTAAMEEHVAEELAKIDRLERQYQDAWERSCLQQTKTRTARSTFTVVGEGARPERDQAQVEQVQRDGNPQFLQGIQWCISERCRLLGLYPKEPPPPPVQVAIVINGVEWSQI